MPTFSTYKVSWLQIRCVGDDSGYSGALQGDGVETGGFLVRRWEVRVISRGLDFGEHEKSCTAPDRVTYNHRPIFEARGVGQEDESTANLEMACRSDSQG